MPLDGGVPEIAGARFPVAFTVIEKVGTDALRDPSLAVITMPDVVPACALVGVPESLPVEVLKLAQEGLFLIEKVMPWPSGSEATGWNTYWEPAVTFGAGVPEIVGARLVDPVTVMENRGSAALKLPSLTLITIPEVVPIWREVGVPDSRPVHELNCAQEGLLAIEKRSWRRSGSAAAGWKLYATPARVVVAGEPEIVGGWLAAAAASGMAKAMLARAISNPAQILGVIPLSPA